MTWQITRHAKQFAANAWRARGTLSIKYTALLIPVLCAVLLVNGAINAWLSVREQKNSLIRLQREQANSAAIRITQYIREIETQLGWMIQSPWHPSALEDRRIDGLRLLRQVPAILELVLVDPNGHEQIRLSRLGSDVLGSQSDLSTTPAYSTAMAQSRYYGPVYFRRNSEPYITLALAGPHREAGVVIAEVNLKLMWDVVSQIQIGEHGRAYVVDTKGRLIAHPDISLVLRNTDMSALPQARAARDSLDGPLIDGSGTAHDLQGQQVLASSAKISPLGWMVVVEQPLNEAYAPIYASFTATIGVLLAGIVLAALASFVLARRLTTPIRQLQASAARIGAGELDHRIVIPAGDELKALGTQFNDMTAQLQASYATLERRVEERTHQLALANQAKSRFLAAASHDLRQPLHALNLFVGQLQSEKDSFERNRIVGQIQAAISNMNELFDALLDISKLDAGVITPVMTEFPVDAVFGRIEPTFAQADRDKGLRLRFVSCRQWIRSDAILLERILLNLVSNAVRYTHTGGVVVGCRRQEAMLRIDVCDSGEAIPDDLQKNIFGEFTRGKRPGQMGPGGLGLGLSIVDRLAKLLDHPIEMSSRLGHGSRFSISIPTVAAGPHNRESEMPFDQGDNPGDGRTAYLIEDDPLALDGIVGTLRNWGFQVVCASSADEAVRALGECGRPPDLIISDYHLGPGHNGMQLIEQLRQSLCKQVPAFLVSGDTSPERLREAKDAGYILLHKPVPPITLRAVIARLLPRRDLASPPLTSSPT